MWVDGWMMEWSAAVRWMDGILWVGWIWVDVSGWMEFCGDAGMEYINIVTL